MSTEILTPEVEVMELESSINTALIKANITDQVLAELKQRHGKVRLKSIEDKESYLECKASSKEIRKIEIAAEKICEVGRAEAIKVQRLWISKQKELLAKTAEIKDPIDADIKKFEDEVERKEIIIAQLREETYMNRQATLLKMGAIYSNGNLELNHISYEVGLIKESDNEMWEGIILPKYRKVYEEIEAGKVEEENKRKQEFEKQKKEREEFELQQKAFREQQEAFSKQQRELNASIDEQARQQRMEQERKESEIRASKDARNNSRIDQLISLGLNYNSQYSAMMFKDINIDIMTELKLWNDTEWNEAIAKITPIIAERKKEEEEKLAAIIEQQKQDAIKKALADEEIKKQQQAQKKLDDLAIANDQVKYQDVVKYLKNTPTHVMKSPTYKGKMNIIADFINNL